MTGLTRREILKVGAKAGAIVVAKTLEHLVMNPKKFQET